MYCSCSNVEESAPQCTSSAVHLWMRSDPIYIIKIYKNHKHVPAAPVTSCLTFFGAQLQSSMELHPTISFEQEFRLWQASFVFYESWHKRFGRLDHLVWFSSEPKRPKLLHQLWIIHGIIIFCLPFRFYVGTWRAIQVGNLSKTIYRHCFKRLKRYRKICKIIWSVISMVSHERNLRPFPVKATIWAFFISSSLSIAFSSSLPSKLKTSSGESTEDYGVVGLCIWNLQMGPVSCERKESSCSCCIRCEGRMSTSISTMVTKTYTKIGVHLEIPKWTPNTWAYDQHLENLPTTNWWKRARLVAR